MYIFTVIKKSTTIWNLISFRRCLCFYGLIKPMIWICYNRLLMIVSVPFQFFLPKILCFEHDTEKLPWCFVSLSGCSSLLHSGLSIIYINHLKMSSFILRKTNDYYLQAKKFFCFVTVLGTSWRILTSAVQQQLPSVLK